MKTLAIVSLSAGLFGEEFVSHEVEIGLKRLESFGLRVKVMPNAARGHAYLSVHPEKRAEDLLQVLRDPEVDIILTDIGGDDTYRLLPYLFEDDALANAVQEKIFLGFSDTTINHFMLHKVGLRTFYGQAFLPDICELSDTMCPYTQRYFEELIHTGSIREITPSAVWYESREEFSQTQVGKPLVSHPDRGFERLQGAPVFSGKILGGCIDTMYDCFDGERYADMPVLCQKYKLFPDAADWKGRILLIESSEEKMSPEKYGKALMHLRDAGVFDAVSGILVGKPMDEAFDSEYRALLVGIVNDPDLPIVCNVNVGHAMPRCILPFGVDATVDVDRQVIRFAEQA